MLGSASPKYHSRWRRRMGYLETARSMGVTMAENLEGAAFPTPTLRNGKKVLCACRELKLNGMRTVIPCGLHKYLKIRFK